MSDETPLHNWLAFSTFNKASRDSRIDLSEKEAEEQYLLEKIFKEVLSLNDHTFFDATKLSEDFNAFCASKRKGIPENPTKEELKAHTCWVSTDALLFRSQNVQMRWRRLTMVNGKALKTTYKKTLQGHYHQKIFTSLPDWACNGEGNNKGALQIEKEYHVLRERQKCFVRIKEALIAYSKLTKELYDVRYNRSDDYKGEHEAAPILSTERTNALTLDHLKDGLTEFYFDKIVSPRKKEAPVISS